MATRFDIAVTDEFFKAIDTSVRIDVTDSAGDPQAMTGWALKWVLKRWQGASAALLTKTTSSGITIGNGAGTDDRATIDIDKADTEDLTARTLYHELYRTDSGSETLLSFGDCVLRERVSV